jgi:hypothetical protein
LPAECFKVGPQPGILGLRQFPIVGGRGIGLREFIGELLSLGQGGVQVLLAA